MSNEFTMFSKQDILEAELKQMLENLPLYLQYNKIQASILKSKFDCLIKEGFTEDQALKLCSL